MSAGYGPGTSQSVPRLRLVGSQPTATSDLIREMQLVDGALWHDLRIEWHRAPTLGDTNAAVSAARRILSIAILLQDAARRAGQELAG